jgi:hypothetical protein
MVPADTALTGYDQYQLIPSAALTGYDQYQLIPMTVSFHYKTLLTPTVCAQQVQTGPRFEVRSQRHNLKPL